MIADSDRGGFPDPAAVAAVDGAVERFTSFWDARGEMGGAVKRWLDDLVGHGNLASAFLAPRSHPLVHLPVWAAHMVGYDNHDTLRDLTLSSIHGYLFIRLIDNVVDNDGAPAPRSLLPVLAVLASQFERPYHGLFDRRHPFWGEFDREWQLTAEAAIADANAQHIDERFFFEFSGRKTRAMMIPVGAVLHLGQATDLLPLWSRASAAFGCWQQFHNDFFDAYKDLGHETNTWLLSHGRSAAQPGERLDQWLRREGLLWAVARLNQLEMLMVRAVDDLGSPEFSEYVVMRSKATRAEASRVLAAPDQALDPGRVR